MFLKQYNYKPRSGSIGSQGGNDAQAQAAQAAQASTQQPAQVAPENKSQGSISAAGAGRRRSSASGGGQFAGLQGYKRNSGEMDRSHIHEQSQQSGVLGQMWTNFTKGK